MAVNGPNRESLLAVGNSKVELSAAMGLGHTDGLEAIDELDGESGLEEEIDLEVRVGSTVGSESVTAVCADVADAAV